MFKAIVCVWSTMTLQEVENSFLLDACKTPGNVLAWILLVIFGVTNLLSLNRFLSCRLSQVQILRSETKQRQGAGSNLWKSWSKAPVLTKCGVLAVFVVIVVIATKQLPGGTEQ